MRAVSVLLKQLTVVIIAAASLVQWTGPSIYTGSSEPHQSAGSGRRGIDVKKPGGLLAIPHLSQADPVKRARISEQYEKLPLRFEINRGQSDRRAQFISRSAGYDLSITPTEALMTFLNSPLAPASAGSAPSPLHMRLIGASSDQPAVGLDELPCTSNYFIGSDPGKWLTNVPAYSKVKCRDVYPGVDLVYYGTKGQLEYDFIVSPGGCPQDIRIGFEGADSVSLNDNGDVVIGTATGEVHHRRPAIYQEKNGVKRVIAARYELRSDREVGFEIGGYDAEQPLIIDPVLSYSTYFGSRSGGDFIRGVAFDAAGDAYIVGGTASPDLPTTPGALQPVNRFSDVFVAKLNPAGTAVVYATYLGGGSIDNGASIAVDDKGNAYVTGTTYSTDFPTTANAFQRGSLGISSHAFVAKLNANGTALAYATYLGSSKEIAAGVAIAVDAAGQATITGSTDSQRFPTTPGAVQPTSGGDYDAFVARLNVDGSALAYATYLGGDSYDTATCLALDAAGNAYVAGETYSASFPTTRNAYQRELQGIRARFITKITTTGDRMIYSTLLGGGDIQLVSGIAVDSAGNAYLTGGARSPFLPTTPGALQTVSVDAFDAFVTKLNDTGSELVYSTFIGGSGKDFGNAIAVDSLGQAYITGTTTSADFPLVRPLQSRKIGGPLFKSTDGGQSWDYVPGLSFEINSLVVDPKVTSTIYALNYNDITKSTDGGTTWRVIGPSRSGSIVIDPKRPAILYAFSSSSFLKSTDGGASWQSTFLPVSGFNALSALVLDPKMPDTIYVSARQSVVPNGLDAQPLDAPPSVMFKSTDGGTSWTTLDFGLPVTSIACLAIDPRMTSIVYAGTESHGLLKSTDGGASWFKPAPSGSLFVLRLVVDPTNSATLYASGYSGISKSTNGGASWSQTPFNRFANDLSIDSETPSTLYTGNFDGLYQTTDGGESWHVALNKIPIRAIAIDAIQHSTIYAAALDTSDVFLAKLNASGAALVYSTYLGGILDDAAMSIAADAYGNVYVAGITYSANFPVTPDAYQPSGEKLYTGFVMRIADPISPRITSVTIQGKKLLVSGEGFDQGAVILGNDTDLQTQNDAATPSLLLVSKRGGKQIGRGQTVTIRVRNADGQLSEGFAFTRSLN